MRNNMPIEQIANCWGVSSRGLIVPRPFMQRCAKKCLADNS
ncbi:hypothetical protein BMETH_406_0 [methanotrophic bacterial endosymbiont of Bathymodiolus sp.]|nr:hypothetical protein BMETH_406_0 [methanotrophic bacterial endosymbiont of Bathymodiolus sp.]